MAKRYHEGPGVMKRKSEMISEDRSAACLLPKGVIEKEWPNGYSYHMKYTDTLFNGVSDQLKEDQADFKRVFSPKKY